MHPVKTCVKTIRLSRPPTAYRNDMTSYAIEIQDYATLDWDFERNPADNSPVEYTKYGLAERRARSLSQVDQIADARVVPITG